MQDKQKALTTLLMLAKDHRSFFESLNPKCQVCQNIFSSQECDMCEDFDMFKNLKPFQKRYCHILMQLLNLSNVTM